MKIKEIIFHLDNVYNGKPWYGKNMVDIINSGERLHSQVPGILAHMLAWRDFALKKVQGINYDIEINSEIDWPENDLPDRQTALDAFKQSNNDLMAGLHDKRDDWMREKVPGTAYNFQFLLEGIVQHDIYHLGQIAILQKEGPSGTSGIEA